MDCRPSLPYAQTLEISEGFETDRLTEGKMDLQLTVYCFLKVPEVRVNAKALLPSTSVISFTLGRGLSFITFVNTVPISANKTINRFALIRKLDVDPIGSAVFNLPAWDSLARQAMIKCAPSPF